MKTMTILFAACGCLMGNVVCRGEAEVPRVEVKPYAVRVNHDTYTTGEYSYSDGVIQKGVTVTLLISMEGDDVKEIECDQEMSRQKLLGVSFVPGLVLSDSKVKRIGEITNFWLDKYKHKPRIVRYCLHFDKLPSSDVDWLRLAGDLPLYYRTNEVQSKPKTLPLEPGASITGDRFNLEITSIEDYEDEKEYPYIIRFKCQWKNRNETLETSEMQFMDENNNVLPSRFKASRGPGKDNEATMTYLLGEKPEKMKCTLKYKALEKIVVPVDVRFPLAFPTKN